uniref:Uncharacterized protein n=1 Tax=Graphocephala atropunctata TaxID=36148 RepID=A0A1B6KDC2_9HEMI
MGELTVMVNMSFKVFIVCVFLACIVENVSAVNCCSEKIIQNIFKLNNCTGDVLEKLYQMGPFEHCLVPKIDMLSTIRCIDGFTSEPCNGSANASFTLRFYDKSIPPRTINYRIQEQKCGHIKNIHTATFEGNSEVFFLSIGPYTACYYRCKQGGKEAPEAGGCIVAKNHPLDNQTLHAAINKCEKNLEEVELFQTFRHLKDYSN